MNSAKMDHPGTPKGSLSLGQTMISSPEPPFPFLSHDFNEFNYSNDGEPAWDESSPSQHGFHSVSKHQSHQKYDLQESLPPSGE